MGLKWIFVVFLDFWNKEAFLTDFRAQNEKRVDLKLIQQSD